MDTILAKNQEQHQLLLKQILLQSIEDSISATSQLKQPHGIKFIEEAAIMLATCFTDGNKVIIAGNGGSLCDANHFAEELTGFFNRPRPPLPVITLSEPGNLTCIANDIGYEWVFARGVEAFGKPGDIFIGLTTSGNSVNIVRAFEVAQQRDLRTIAFLGKGGGRLKGFADLELIINEAKTSDRVQEAHMTAMHIIIQLIEKQLFPGLS